LFGDQVSRYSANWFSVRILEAEIWSAEFFFSAAVVFACVGGGVVGVVVVGVGSVWQIEFVYVLLSSIVLARLSK
jgi:hypothetical protein